MASKEMESSTEEGESYSTIEEMNAVFSKKISMVRKCLDLRFVDDDEMTKSFGRVESSIQGIKSIFKEIREEIQGGQKQLTELQNLLRKLENINERLTHMESNIPAVLNKAEVAPPQKEVKGDPKPGPSVSNKVVAKMQHVTLTEFDAVPSYMKGRIKYEQINKFVDEFNTALDGKYKFLSMPRKGMSGANLKNWQKLKAQENEETKGFMFCTADDLKEYGGIKGGPSTSNMLTILRHCSKVKEIRRPGSIIRYAVPR